MESPGTETTYSCKLCDNKGGKYIVVDGEVMWQICKCYPVRQSILALKRSGLEYAVRTQRFDTYKATEPWQVDILDKAKQYAAEPTGWFFMGGQVGAGKSHICTAICRELLLQGHAVKYYPWRDVESLKGCYDSVYRDAIEELKTVNVLYFDDLFKGATDPNGRPKRPSDWEIKFAVDVLNHRYINRMVTIISGEFFIDELLDVDGGLGSRIYQMSKEHQCNIKRDPERNYRMREYA